MKPIRLLSLALALLASWAGAAPLRLEGIQAGRKGLTLQGAPLVELGRGDLGVVYQHPALPGAVIKLVEHSPMMRLQSDHAPAATLALEERTARALAAADAGPAFLGRAEIDGRLVSVRERVHGETVEDLIALRRFKEEERTLVVDLLERLAAAGLQPSDLRPPNVMIGATESDPRRRAHLVDGGRLSPLAPGAGAWTLLDQHVVLAVRHDPHVGEIVDTKPLRVILDAGVRRSNTPPLATRLKGWLKRLLGR